MIKLLEHTRRPDISFSRTGLIRISARAARLLSINPGDAINVARDDDGLEYYLCATTPARGRHRARCYRSKRGGNNLCANSVVLCRAVMQAAGVDSPSVSFACGEPVSIHGATMLPIIIRIPI